MKSTGISQAGQDRLVKEKIKQERREQRHIVSSSRDDGFEDRIERKMNESNPRKQPTIATSQEEKDRLIKEQIKQERREQSKAVAAGGWRHPGPSSPGVQFASSAAAGYAKADGGYGNSVPMSQEEKDRLMKERIKQQMMEQSKVASSFRQSATTPGVQHIPPQDKKHPPELEFSALKVEGGKTKDRESKKAQRKKVAASLRQSTWAGLYDEMIENEFKADARSRIPPQSEEGNNYEKTSSSKGKPIEQDFPSSIKDINEEQINKEEPDRLKKSELSDGMIEDDNSKSKHRSHHKKSHSSELSDGRMEEDERTKSRRHKRTELGNSTTNDKSKSRRNKRTELKSHLKSSLASDAPGDDELSRRIEEKLRERERMKKKKKRSTRRGPSGPKELAESHGTSSMASNDDHDSSADQSLDLSEDRRESIARWTEKYAIRQAMALAERTPEMDWLSSFYRCDPRWQIMKFFNEVAREGGVAKVDENFALSPLAQLFDKARVFTVWRPTSDEAIKNMMLGIATGKGLDIKGKSAKKGNISSYVPFIQIYEDEDKEKVRAYLKDGRIIRVFYQNEAARNEAHEMITDVKDYMLFAAMDAMRVLSDEFASTAEQELAMKHLMYDDTNLAVEKIDAYANSNPPAFGLNITERLFWEAYVMIQDCSRPSGTEWDIGRESEVNFMEMNLKTMRYTTKPGDARPVVYQMSKCSPMEPRTLLVAYEEYGRVKPVVSDFDCFLIGTRGVKYKQPIPKDQVDLVKWSVDNIRDVLDDQASKYSTNGWMETWFGVLKKAALKGFYPRTPKYGNGDPRSYKIIEVAVSRLSETGCVRHGAECFNYFFPQDIDDTLLIVSDTLPGKLKWMKVNEKQLQEVLLQKIDEGFTFRKDKLVHARIDFCNIDSLSSSILMPALNPKWVLCDPGWKRVYDKLLRSKMSNVQDSLNCWLPPGSGIREKIEDISLRHPSGFGIRDGAKQTTEGTELMDTMEYRLRRMMKIQRAWRKLRLVLFWLRFIREKRAAVGIASRADETLGCLKRS